MVETCTASRSSTRFPCSRISRWSSSRPLAVAMSRMKNQEVTPIANARPHPKDMSICVMFLFCVVRRTPNRPCASQFGSLALRRASLVAVMLLSFWRGGCWIIVRRICAHGSSHHHHSGCIRFRSEAVRSSPALPRRVPSRRRIPRIPCGRGIHSAPQPFCPSAAAVASSRGAGIQRR